MAPQPPPPPPPPSVDLDQEQVQGSVTSDASDTPPRSTSRKSSRPTGGSGPKAGERPAPKPKLQRRLEEFFAAPAAVYAATGHQYPAQIIALRSPQLAEDLYALSQESPPVKRVLEKMLEGGAWGGVIISAASILIPVLSYHGVLPIGDPFSVIMPAPQRDARRPIVPPPPGPGDAPTMDTNGARGEGPDYTPPVGAGPPGTVTVAGTNAGHVGSR